MNYQIFFKEILFVVSENILGVIYKYTARRCDGDAVTEVNEWLSRGFMMMSRERRMPESECEII